MVDFIAKLDSESVSPGGPGGLAASICCVYLNRAWLHGCFSRENDEAMDLGPIFSQTDIGSGKKPVVERDKAKRHWGSSRCRSSS